jgi:hypothetical protein
MSATTTHPRQNSHRQANDRHEITLNPPAAPEDSDEVIARLIADPLDQGTPVAVEHFVAHVLRRANDTAKNDNNPDEARAIFHVAVSFAAELETTDPEFDRFRFIETATGL